MVQLRIDEETTIKNLVLKTARELQVNSSSNFIHDTLDLEEHHSNNDIQQILYAIQDFINERPVEFEYIRLRDAIRKLA